MEIKNKFLLCSVSYFLFFSACGGDIPGKSSVSYSGETGTVKAVVSNSKSFNPSISHGKIEKYKITITAEDIAEPIIAEFEGNAGAGTVENVPSGKGRKLKVEAVNSNSSVIREGDEKDLEILGGEINEVAVALESVPIFANISEGNSVPNTRFIAKIFSDPSDKVKVEDEFQGSSSALMDVSVGSTELLPEASSGIAKFSPALLPVGEHKFIVKNLRTGRFTAITVFLTDGAKLKAAPLYSGGVARLVKFGHTVMEGI